MKPVKTNMTRSQIERLKRLIADGASPFGAAAAMKTSILSVRRMARALDTPFPAIYERRNFLMNAIGDGFRR